MMRPVESSVARAPRSPGLIQSSILGKVRVELSPVDLPPVTADPTQIRQVVMNLVVNGPKRSARRAWCR